MSDPRDHFISAKYDEEDITVGVSMGDVTPWLKVVGNTAGGLFGGGVTGSKPAGGGADTQAMMAMMMQQQAAQVAAQQEAERRATESRNKTILYAGLGVAGLAVIGGLIYALKR